MTVTSVHPTETNDVCGTCVASTDVCVEVAADTLYEEYRARITPAFGLRPVDICGPEACFLYWMADLGFVTVEMAKRIFEGAHLLAIGNLERRLEDAGINPRSIFATRCDSGFGFTWSRVTRARIRDYDEWEIEDPALTRGDMLQVAA